MSCALTQLLSVLILELRKPINVGRCGPSLKLALVCPEFWTLVIPRHQLNKITSIKLQDLARSPAKWKTRGSEELGARKLSEKLMSLHSLPFSLPLLCWGPLATWIRVRHSKLAKPALIKYPNKKCQRDPLFGGGDPDVDQTR